MAWNTPGSNNENPDGNNDPDRGLHRPGGGGFSLPPGIRDFFRDSGIFRWIFIAIVLIFLASCFQLVGEQQRGVVLRFGEYSRVMTPGPNFKLPWPIESVIKVNATQIKTFSNTVPVLTRDENIVNVTMNVQYRVGDSERYLFGSREADRVLEQVSQSVVREQVGRSDLDTVLGERGPLSANAREHLQASLNAYETGLIVTALNLQDARPPEAVKPAFDEVNSAQQIKDQLQNEARAYEAKIVPEARGEAERRITEAAGYKEAKVAIAEGDVSRFISLQQEYAKAPEVTRKRLWLETMQDVLTNNRKVIGDGRQLIYVPMTASNSSEKMQSSTSSSPPLLTPDLLPTVTQQSQESARNPVRDAQRTGRE